MNPELTNEPTTKAMPPSQDLVAAPFRIIADVSQEADGWQFDKLYDARASGRTLHVPIDYRDLDFADYIVEGLPLYIVRKKARSFALAFRHWPQSVCQELEHLRDLEATGSSCLIVTEGSAEEIDEVLAAEVKVCADGGIGVPWLFAPNRSAAELIVFAVIQRAWERAQHV